MLGRSFLWVLALGLAAFPALAQAPQTQPSQKPSPKPKKVWTNDDLEALRGGVSTPVAAPAAPAAEAAQAAPEKPRPLPQEKDPKYYRSRLEPLRKQLADVEAKIKETQAALNDPFRGTNAVVLAQPTPVMRPEDQFAAYEKQRKELQQQIDDLEAQARQNGISPGDIR